MAFTNRRTVADGSARYDVSYRDPNGLQRSKTFRRAKDAAAFEATVEADKLRGQWIDPAAGKVTFRDYSDEWLELQTVDLSSRIQMESRLRVHAHPVLGRVQLRNLKPSTVQKWLRSMETLHPNTRALIFGHVQGILDAAVDDELIAKNPCKAKSVRRPKAVHRKVKPWEKPAVLAVREALPERYRVVVTTGAGLGLRQGESFGLSPDDIDWLRGKVQIRRQVKLIGHRLAFGPPKYGKEREIPLPASVREWLAAYLTRFPARTVTLPWVDPENGKPHTARLLVTSRESRALNRTYFNSRLWKPALEKAGIEATRENGTHALRHFYASVLLDAGENVKALSEYLGHADPGFTLRVYTHLMKASAERTRRAVDGVFGPVVPELDEANRPDGPTAGEHEATP